MKLSEHVYLRKMYFSFVTPAESRCIAVYATLLKGRKNILIDCGVSYNYPDIEQLCAEGGVELPHISAVINTHCHADHCGCNSVLKGKLPELEFWAHPIAKVMLADKGLHFSIRPVPYFHYLMASNTKVTRILNDGEWITETGYPIQILYTPGHSKDSISVYLPQEKTLIAGDAIINMEEMPFYDDVADMYNTMEKLEKLDIRYVVSAFSGLWDMEKNGNMFEAARKRLDRIQGTICASVKADANVSIQDVGMAVLNELGINIAPSPLFLKGIKSGIEYVWQKENE